MPSSKPISPRPLPLWLTVLASAIVAGHLLCIGLLALAPEHGPWPTNVGMTRIAGPQFATVITSRYTVPYYLHHLRMSHNYHFESNRLQPIASSFEVILKDANGTTIKTLKFPDEKANFWVRHRQELLVQGFGEPQPVEPPGTEKIAPPSKNKDAKVGKEDPVDFSKNQGPKVVDVDPAELSKNEGANVGKEDQVEFWYQPDENIPEFQLKRVAKSKLPRDRPAMRPSDWTKLRMQSYLRYLCRQHGATSAELVHHNRVLFLPVIMPWLFLDSFPPGTEPAPERGISEAKSYFGEYRREK